MSPEQKQPASILSERYKRSKDFQKRVAEKILELGQLTSQILQRPELSALTSSLGPYQLAFLQSSIAAENGFAGLDDIRKREKEELELINSVTGSPSSFWLTIGRHLALWVLRNAARGLATEREFRETVVLEIIRRKKKLASKLYPDLDEDQRYQAIREIELAAHDISTILGLAEDPANLKKSLSESALFWQKRILS